MTELASCPFCGGEASFEHSDERWSVGCIDINGECYGFQSMTTFARQCEAAAAWNTRANPAAEALAKGLDDVLPYTEAERLAEAASVRCGATRDPINKAIKAARAVLSAYRAGRQP